MSATTTALIAVAIVVGGTGTMTTRALARGAPARVVAATAVGTAAASTVAAGIFAVAALDPQADDANADILVRNDLDRTVVVRYCDECGSISAARRETLEPGAEVRYLVPVAAQPRVLVLDTRGKELGCLALRVVAGDDGTVVPVSHGVLGCDVPVPLRVEPE